MTPTPPSPMSRWRPVGGAFLASTLVHALMAASLGVILLHGGPRPEAVPPAPLHAALVSFRPPAPREPPPAPAEPPQPPRSAVASREVVAALAAPALPPEPPVPAGRLVNLPAPWVGAAIDVSLPPGFRDEPAALRAGIELYESRSIPQLGEDIERRIRAGYTTEPDEPMVLRSPEVLGYPLDALEAGIEGRVLVWMGVDEDRKIIEAEMLDGPDDLRLWVQERLGRLVEQPARDRKGYPMRSWVALEIVFSRDAAVQAFARDPDGVRVGVPRPTALGGASK